VDRTREIARRKIVVIVVSDFGAGHEVRRERAALEDIKRSAVAEARHIENIEKGRKR
jgi:hypothetical protein